MRAITDAVSGLHYELVDVEHGARGLLRVTIDRVPGHRYAGQADEQGEFITVEDCERVTRQLQYVLEVEGADYARLEVSSPGLDRPLKTEAHYRRFAGQAVSIALKLPFEGRKHWRGVLHVEGAAFSLHLTGEGGKPTGQVLGFTLDEVREAALVPVLNFKGRSAPRAAGTSAAAAEPAAAADDKDNGGTAE